MKIEIGYGNDYSGIAESNGTKITYSGSSTQFAQNMIEDFQSRLNKNGDDLLQGIVDYFSQRSGRTWAKKL